MNMPKTDFKVGMLVRTTFNDNRQAIGLIVQYTGGSWVLLLRNEKIVSWHTDFLEPVND
jgi:hypothetical protein